MREVLELIKARIEECKSQGDTFCMHKIDRDDVHIEIKDLPTGGSALLHKEYDVRFDCGDRMTIDYQSKDKCRTFQINPDRSYINVECSDPDMNFVDAWDEKY